MVPHSLLCLCLVLSLRTFLANAALQGSATRKFDWQIQYTNVTRLCHTKSLISVNGEFPGPTVHVDEGDTVVVNITNFVNENITIHWHGVRQLLSAWSDGTAFITQCPIQKGTSFVHRFQIIGQRGTLLWHAHNSWQRATLYGAFIIRPRKTLQLPFRRPYKEIPILLGEWWNADVESIISTALVQGGGYDISNATTINGHPGALYNALYNCSKGGTKVFKVRQGQTYLLRVINAAVNFELYFSVANHSLTVVEIDAEYTKAYPTDVILVAPGQTTNVLLTANQSVGHYIIAASIYSPPSQSLVPIPSTPTTAILSYVGATSSSNYSALPLPAFPAVNDTAFALKFLTDQRTRPFSSGFYYMDVPQHVDEDLFFTIGYAVKPCPQGLTCRGPTNVTKLATSVNNVTFVTPNISLLQAYYNGINGVYEPDFPDVPLYQYNYTAVNPTDKFSVLGTKLKVLNFNSTVQIVFQDTATLFFESHPIHLHGQNFYVVGAGKGTYDPNKDPQTFNLADPTSRNTINVPAGGWAAIRFRAVNPGVWYMHCHLDIHNSWGMAMAFVVKNGVGNRQTLPPPPTDLPSCS